MYKILLNEKQILAETQPDTCTKQVGITPLILLAHAVSHHDNFKILYQHSFG